PIPIEATAAAKSRAASETPAVRSQRRLVWAAIIMHSRPPRVAPARNALKEVRESTMENPALRPRRKRENNISCHVRCKDMARSEEAGSINHAGDEGHCQ